MKGREEHTVFGSTLAVSLFVTLVYSQYLYSANMENAGWLLSKLKSSSLVQYASVIICFVAIFFMACAVWHLVLIVKGQEIARKNEKLFSNRVYNIVTMAAVAAEMFLAAHWFLISGKQEFAYEGTPLKWVPFSVIIIMIIIAFLVTAMFIYRGKDISSAVLILAYGILAMLYFARLYCPSLFKGDVHHGIAVMESVFNAYDMTPFSGTTSSIYGHYALFFIIPMRILGGNMKAAAAVMAFFGVITFTAACYITHYLMPKNWLRLMAVCANILFVVVIRNYNYWQLQPIRLMFPLVICAYIVFLVKNEKQIWGKKWMWLGYTLSALGVVWNTETGIICLLAFSASMVGEGLRQKIEWGGVLKRIIAAIFLCLGSVGSAVGIVNVYNWICGGAFIVKDFFFGLLETDIVDVTRYDMLSGNHPWLYMMLVFMGVLGWGISENELFRRKNEYSPNALIAISVGITGLLSLSYYANRAAVNNLEIAYPMFVCALSVLVNITWDALGVKEKRKQYMVSEISAKAVCSVSLALLSILSVMVCFFPVRFRNLRLAEYWEYASVKEDIEMIGECISDDTYGVGSGIAQIYHTLGRDGYAHYMDASDWGLLPDEFYDEIVDDVSQHENVLLGLTDNFGCQKILQKRLLLQNPDYVLTQVFYINGRYDGRYIYYYYNRVGTLAEGGTVTELAGNMELKEGQNILSIPVEISENTVYKIELTADISEVNDSITDSYIDLFGGDKYDSELRQTVSNFWNDGQDTYVFYINSGEIDDDVEQVYLRLVVDASKIEGEDGDIDVKSLKMVEMQEGEIWA